MELPTRAETDFLEVEAELKQTDPKIHQRNKVHGSVH